MVNLYIQLAARSSQGLDVTNETTKFYMLKGFPRMNHPGFSATEKTSEKKGISG